MVTNLWLGQILDMIADVNPAIITVTGRPRTPRDQGSVERANQIIKKVIADVCAERRNEGKDDNWTMFLGRVTSQLNTHRTRQSNSVESYPTVFGVHYHLLTKTSLEDTRKCKTIEELKDLVIDDGHLQSYVAEYYDTETKYTAEEEKQLQEQCNKYWIDDNIDQQMHVPSGNPQSTLQAPESLTMLPNQETSLSLASREANYSQTLIPSTSVLFDPVLFTLPTPPPSSPSSTSSIIKRDLNDILVGEESSPAFDVKKEPASTPSTTKRDLNDMLAEDDESSRTDDVKKSDDDSVVPASPHKATLTNDQPLLSHNFRKIKGVTEAWQDADMVITRTRVKNKNKIYTAVLPRLYCAQCLGDSYVISYDETYKNWVVNEDMWFEKEFINQFAVLLQHTSHQMASAHVMPQLVICNFPEHDWTQGTESITVNKVVSESVVCVLCDGTHYAVMEVVFQGQTISVYDGFAASTSVHKWVKYAKFVLQTIGVIPLTATGEL